MSMRSPGFVVVLVIALATPVYVHAQNETALEIARLPPYCKFTQAFRGVAGSDDRAEAKRWEELLGPTFWHLHHYCRGLIWSNRAITQQSRRSRLHALNTSIIEFDYVIQRSPQDFVLLPEILTKKGENLILMDRAPIGIFVLQRAAELKPDYWPPYAALADYFRRTGDVAKAREWVEKGLAAAPDAQPLQRRLAELGETKGNRRSGERDSNTDKGSVPDQAQSRGETPSQSGAAESATAQ